MDEYIKREDALNALLDEMVGTGYQSRAMGAIKFIPTADVVPKSAVDMSQHLLKDAWKRIEELDNLCGELQKAKTEYAREIFAEIETIAKTVAYPETLVDGVIVSRNLPGMYLDLEDYVELKKKHTGESDVKRDTV